jgi:hypothetical protein
MKGIKEFFGKTMLKFGVKRTKKKSSIIQDLLDNPETMRLEAYIEGDEIICKITRKKKEEEGQ